LAKRPERIRAWIVNCSYSFMAGGSCDDVDRHPAELPAVATSVDPALDAKYRPSTERLARIQQLGCAARSAWGCYTGTAIGPGGYTTLVDAPRALRPAI
jgi:hypothetical protein